MCGAQVAAIKCLLTATKVLALASAPIGFRLEPQGAAWSTSDCCDRAFVAFPPCWKDLLGQILGETLGEWREEDTTPLHRFPLGATRLLGGVG